MTAARREADPADARSLAGARERGALRTRPSFRDDMAIGRREGDRRSARSPLFVQAEFSVAPPIFTRGPRRKKRKMTEAFSHENTLDMKMRWSSQPARNVYTYTTVITRVSGSVYQSFTSFCTERVSV